MPKKPIYVSVARVWPAETGNAEALRAASKRLEAINPAESARIKRLAGEGGK